MKKFNIQIEAEIEMDDDTFVQYQEAEAKDEFLGSRLTDERGISIQYYNLEHQQVS